jgi:predicted transcriptional regulator
MRVLPTSAQLIAARALLQLEQRELAQLSGLHVNTLVRMEADGWKLVPGTTTTINRVLDVLEKRGVEFIENGVRLAKRPRRPRR